MSRPAHQARAINWVEAFGLSAFAHVFVVYFALDFINDIRFLPDTDAAPPDLLVTSLILDAATLEQATSTAPDSSPGAPEETASETPDAVEPETLAEADAPEDTEPSVVQEPEELAALEPETPEALEPEATETVEPESLEPQTAELAEPEPATPEPVAPETVTPETVEPETLTADAPAEEPETLTPQAPAALAPEALSPLRPQNDTLAALAPVAPVAGAGVERLTASSPSLSPEPVQPLASTGVQTVAPTDVQTLTTASTAQAIAPRVTRPPLATPPPPQNTTANTPPPPGSPAAVVAELVAKIRARVGDTCLVAVPQQTADGAPELVMLSASEPAITDFAQAVLADVDPPPGQRAVLIDERQCDALNFIRENPSYPAFRLSVGLATDQLSGQATLQGAIGRAGGNYVSLLLVDDNGVVQELNQYLTFAGGEARFEVPLRRAGNSRDTSQLLFAVASNARPTTLDSQNGQEASVFFEALRAELGTTAPIVMIPFDVR